MSVGGRDLSERASVSVIIPTFNRFDLLRACLESLVNQTTCADEIIVLDDCSSSGVASDYLTDFADAPTGVVFSRSVSNRGYTATVNKGIAMSSGELVCVLNSDTVLGSHTVERLTRAFELRGSLYCGFGPLSNAASYQSLPTLVDGNGKFSTNPEFGASESARQDIEAFLFENFAGSIADFPVLNGFCSIFRRASLESVGLLDEDSFPVGYGEENDLCLRLRARTGLRLGVCADAFVYHHKSASFGERREALARQGRKALMKLYGERHLKEIDAQLRKPGLIDAVRESILGQSDAP